MNIADPGAAGTMRDVPRASAMWPTVSVIIPVLNEERYIEDCLRCVLDQDYPGDRVEIIVVDGASTDRTREIVQRLAAADGRIRLLSNPKRRTPFAMNIGLAAATGEVVVRIDGHSVIGVDHLRKSVDYLFSSGADHIGGVMRATGRTYLQRAIALAMSSPFGVGTARFRYTRREHDIDTVPFGAFRRETLLRLGGFDERFVIGQDSEFDHRLILSGGRVRVTPEIHTEYYCRDSFKGLSLQYFRYGKAKAKILHKHRSLPSPRAALPGTFVGLVIILLALAPFSPAARRGLRTLLAAYLAGCLGAGTLIAAKGGWRYFPALPPILATLHWSHGLGFLSAAPVVLEPRPENPLQGSLDASRAASRMPGDSAPADVGAAS